MDKKYLLKAILLGAIAVFPGGCIRASTPDLPQSSTQKSYLTAGMVKKYIKVGTATQTDMFAVFGAPNIITRDKNGNEVWTYDRQSVASASEFAAWNAGGNATVDAPEDRLPSFLSLPLAPLALLLFGQPLKLTSLCP